MNEYNYVDTVEPIPESPKSKCKNSLLCLAAPQLSVKFDMPFTSFAPATMESVFRIEVGKDRESLGSVSLFIPRHSPSHEVQAASFLSQASYDEAKLGVKQKPDVYILEPEEWRKYSNREAGFVDVASFLALSLRFEYKFRGF